MIELQTSKHILEKIFFRFFLFLNFGSDSRNFTERSYRGYERPCHKFFSPKSPNNSPQGTDVVIAMAIHKLTLPIRIPLTLFLIPLAHRFAVRTGTIWVFDKFSSVFGMSAAEGNANDVGSDKGGVEAVDGKKGQ